MAMLAVAAAGAAIGSAAATAAGIAAGSTFLGMTAAGWGWTVGSMVGSMLFAEKAKGPEIQDGKFTSTVYGQVIPVSYGTIDHGGQIVWWSGLDTRTEEVGGKGGGGAEVQKARMSILLAVCEGPQASVPRIWANGRLIATFNGIGYDLDEEVLPAGDVRVYLGTEDQVADPTYEAAVGADSAVPYRGTVMVMIENLEGEQFANRPPTFKVEVSSGEPEYALTIEDMAAPTARGNWSTPTNQLLTFDYDQGVAVTLDGTKFWTVDPDAWTVEEYTDGALPPTTPPQGVLSKYGAKYVTGPARTPGEAGPDMVMNDDLWATPYKWDDYIVLRRDRAYYFYWPAVFSQSGDLSTWRVSFTNGLYGATVLVPTVSEGGDFMGWAGGIGNPSWCYGSVGEPGGKVAYRLNAETGGTYTTSAWSARYGYFVWWILEVDGVQKIREDGLADWPGIAYDATRDRLWTRNLTEEDTLRITWIELWDDCARYEFYAPEMDDFDRESAIAYNPDQDLLILSGRTAGGTGTRIVGYRTNKATLDALRESPPVYPSPVFDLTGGLSPLGGVVGNGKLYEGYSRDDYAVFSSGGGSLLLKLTFGGGVGTGTVTLQEIVEDVCARAGLPAENLDATAGTDIVGGYRLSAQTTARQAIEALVPGYFFDMPESGEQLVLRKRGASAVATIDAGELGARVFAADSEPAVPYELEHVDEEEAPRVLELSWIDRAANYDPGTQKAERAIGTSKTIAQITVPVVFHGGVPEAARAAWVNLLHAHSSKNPIKFALSHQYEHIEAADAIEVPLAAGVVQRVRVERLTRARPLLEVEAVLEEQSIYTDGLGGAPRYQGPQQIGFAGLSDTALALLDVPPLRDAEDLLVVYSAMAGATRDAAWVGATLYRSADDGTSYAAQHTVSAAATIGATVGALADWTGGNRWDDDSVLEVVLASGSFASATDLAVLNGANALAVASGDDLEILQFANAELISTNRWRLTRLLRGRKGTERAIAGHAAGDRVVALDVATLRVVAQVRPDIGSERLYKGVTIGQAVSDADEVPFTLVGRSLLPLSPVSIRGERDIGGDLTITWIRRARIYAEWTDDIDVPLDEPYEEYEIDVMDGTAVVRTLTATGPTVEYTAAQQTTDFGAPSAAVTVRIHQRSNRIGRGHAGEATV